MKDRPIPRAAVVYMVLWPLAVLITVCIGLLLVPAESRSAKFAVALGGVLLGESLSLCCGAAFTLRRESARTTFPFSLGGLVATKLYLAGTLALALLAATPISDNWLIAAELGWFLLLSLAAGAFTLAGPHVAAVSETHARQRAPHLVFKEQLAGVVDRVDLIRRKEVQPLREAIARFRDDATHATSESLPGSESIDSEMSDSLCGIEQKIQKLEQVCADAGDGEFQAIEEKVLDLVQEVARLRQLLDRRERRVAELR